MCSEDLSPRMARREFLRLGSAGLAGAVLLGSAGATGGLAQTVPSLKTEFELAAKKYRVPVELLLAMGYVNTLWEMPPPTASDYQRGDTEGRGDYGIMQLTQNPSRDTLGRAAKLTGLSEEQLKNDRASNVLGGAALLSDIVGRAKPKDLNGWQDALVEYRDTELYAQEVFEALKKGASLTNSSGESLELAPQDVEMPRIFTARGKADYPKAAWRPAASCNYTKSRREASYNITKIVVHVAQGSASSAVSWFKNCDARASAHYVVSRKGRVFQCVRDKNIAWHAGWWKTNTHSIGIEHAGYIGDRKSFTKKMYRASARLSAWCCKEYRIPIDRDHIIGHDEVPGCSDPNGGGVDCHRDPGKYWNWNRYMRLVRRFR